MFGPLNLEESALIGRLPLISRARGHRLYAMDGTRWLDCWADGGRALAGHRPPGVSLRLKNEIDRGLYAPYPNLWTLRLQKALLRLFPDYKTVRIYRNAAAAIAAAGLDLPPADPLDLPSYLEAEAEEKIHKALWGRPMLPGHPSAEYLLPVLPVSGLSDNQPLLSRQADPLLPESDPASPVILAALTRSCGSAGHSFPPISFPIADIWERRGPYMCYRGRPGDYQELFESMFARKILIAPSHLRPSVLPPDLSAPEKAAFGSGSRLR